MPAIAVMPGELFSCSYWNGRTPCFIIGDKLVIVSLLVGNILAPFTAGSNEVFLFSRWGIWDVPVP